MSYTIAWRGGCLSAFYCTRDLYPGDSPEQRASAKVRASIEHNQNSSLDCLYLVQSPLLCYGLSEIPQSAWLARRVVLLDIDYHSAEVFNTTCSGSFADYSLIRPWENVSSELTCHTPLFIYPEVSESMHSFSIRVEQALIPYFSRVRRVVWISANGARSLNYELWKKFTEYIDQAFQRYWRNRSTLQFHGRQWIRNAFATVAEYAHNGVETFLKTVDFAFLSHSLVVCCAAGPSLNAALADIKQMRAQIRVVCADTALQVLLQAGIEPDVCIVLESQWHNLDDFIGMALPKRMKIWADIWAHAPTLRLLARAGLEISFFASQLNNNEAIENFTGCLGLVQIPALASVGVSAVYLCAKSNPKVLALIGCDFMTQPSRSHANDSPSHTRGLRSWNRLSSHPYLRVWSGQPDLVLESYGELARQVLQQYTQGIRLVDLRHCGMDLFIERASLKSMFSELANHQYPIHAHSLPVSLDPHNRSLVSTEVWLRGIEQNLREILHYIPLLSDFEMSHVKEELSAIIETNYLCFMDFPELSNLPCIGFTESFLYRLTVRCNELIKIICI